MQHKGLQSYRQIHLLDHLEKCQFTMYLVICPNKKNVRHKSILFKALIVFIYFINKELKYITVLTLFEPHPLHCTMVNKVVLKKILDFELGQFSNCLKHKTTGKKRIFWIFSLEKKVLAQLKRLLLNKIRRFVKKSYQLQKKI